MCFKCRMEALQGLLKKLGDVGDKLPDRRTGKNTRYRMRDIVMGAFSMFFMQSESFLAFQRHLQEDVGDSNCRTLFGMSDIPSDDHIRNMLDGVDPSCFDGLFRAAVDVIRNDNDLAAFRRLNGHVLIPLDGTEYCVSRKVHCEKCSHRKRNDGSVEYFHTFVGACLVAPGHKRVLPLPPEFVTPQDGHEKQDCEQMAGQRWLQTHGPVYADLKPIYLGDDLYAKQPMCEKVQAVGGHFIFTCKPSSHKTLAEYIHGATFHEHQETHGYGKAQRTYTYRWIENVPIRDGKDAMEIHYLELRITNETGKQTYYNTFATDLDITPSNVAEIGACGRTRWKIENEGFNTLKNNGYHLEHNFGHGKQTLASVLAMLNLVAFAFHCVGDLAEPLWKKAMEYWGKRRTFFSRLWNVTIDRIFVTWDALMNGICCGKLLPQGP